MLIIAEEELSLRLQKKGAYTHCESSTDAPTRRDRTLFVVRSTEAPFAKRLSATESFSFLALVENNDWMVPTKPAMESYNAV
jgi:hypothetical protein